MRVTRYSGVPAFARDVATRSSVWHSKRHKPRKRLLRLRGWPIQQVIVSRVSNGHPVPDGTPSMR